MKSHRIALISHFNLERSKVELTGRKVPSSQFVRRSKQVNQSKCLFWRCTKQFKELETQASLSPITHVVNIICCVHIDRVSRCLLDPSQQILCRSRCWRCLQHHEVLSPLLHWGKQIFTQAAANESFCLNGCVRTLQGHLHQELSSQDPNNYTNAAVPQ